MARWQKVSEEEAKHHRLYGVRGWLLLFVVLQVFYGLAGWGALRSQAHSAGLSLLELFSISADFRFFIVIQAYATVVFVTIVWMAIARASPFRVTTFCLMLLSPLAMFIAAVASPGNQVAARATVEAIPGWALSLALWGTYLFRSRRVRVTFEHMVKVDDRAEAAAPVR